MKTNTITCGKIWKMHDSIDTDQIIASQYLQISTIEEMEKYTFSTLYPDFAKKISDTNIIAAGSNFGCGSSREQAPAVLKSLGVKAIIASSFARIFFRNSINIGLPLIVCPQIIQKLNHGCDVKIDFMSGLIMTNSDSCKFNNYPQYLQTIINSGGLINMINGQTYE